MHFSRAALSMISGPIRLATPGEVALPEIIIVDSSVIVTDVFQVNMLIRASTVLVIHDGDDVSRLLRQQVIDRFFGTRSQSASSLADVAEKLLIHEHVESALDYPGSGESTVTPEKTMPKKIALVTSNGAGMGHLTRLLGIARKITTGVEVRFISLSQAVPVVAAQGFSYEYIASRGDMGCTPSEWNRYAAERFTHAFADFEPDVIVFDGTWPYAGFMSALKTTQAKKVWSRRGMWKSAVTDKSIKMSSSAFDLIVEPGEYAASFDEGVTPGYSDAVRVAPITVLDETECLSRADARTELGIGQVERAVLITLGAGNINAIDSTVRTLIGSIRAQPEPWTIFLTKAPIAVSDQTFDGVREIAEYPLARVARAFDYAVSASGYNSYHEWVQLRLPTLWLPNTSTSTDDQIARGRYASHVGAGLCLVEPSEEEIDLAISELSEHETRKRMRQVMAETSFVNGAAVVAELLEEMAG
ncbi:hypothetical protein ASE96_18055 [Arthrobacter sp. Leaf69]|nr:hypothetical protein ASE96_18055 [Arthrobacter sp. Leaf69]